MKQVKIVIAGIGGVGGYFGGLLAKAFQDSAEVSVYFLARGKHLQAIRTHGLEVVSGEDTFIAQPGLATDDASETGTADFVILCTKGYDLEQMVQQLHPCIDKHTVILPLLNGADNRERVQKLLPENTVYGGCAYIVSRLTGPGRIENTGNVQKLYFGLDGLENERLSLLEDLFKQAGVDATLSANISDIIWSKFIFISAIATATSYFDLPVGALLEDAGRRETLITLIEEVIRVAKAKGITTAADIHEKTLKQMESLPYATTSSMHSDFQVANHATEVESLTGYVVREGHALGIAVPVFEKLYAALEKRSTR